MTVDMIDRGLHRQVIEAMEGRYQQRIAELETSLAEQKSNVEYYEQLLDAIFEKYPQVTQHLATSILLVDLAEAIDLPIEELLALVGQG